MKRCYHCNTWKDKTEFHLDRNSREGIRSCCKKCAYLRHRAWKLRGAEHIKADFCKICGTRQNLVFDHDHKTGLWRGCLCKSCNFALGLFQDDPMRLSNAIIYLASQDCRNTAPSYPALEAGQ